MRNNSDQAVQIHPRIRYVFNDQPNVIDLAALSLAANQVRELDLTSAINTIGNNTISDAGIEIDHTGNPGTVMAYASSIDQSGSSVFDVPIKDPTSEMGFKGGSYPWNIESDNRAVLHIKNIDQPGDGQKRQAMAKLYFDGGEYNIPLQEMEAGQTVEVDIKKLRDDQVPDVLGHLIPLTVTSGQLDWGPRAQRGQFIGRLVQYSPSGAMASSFSCVGACLCDNGFGSAVIYPGLFSGFIGDTFGLQSTETDVDCNQQVVYTYNVGPTQALQYSSSDSNVVTISDGTATLVGSGSAEISADWDAFQVTQHCFYSAEGDCVDATCNSRTVPTPIVIGDVNTLTFTLEIDVASVQPAGAGTNNSATVTVRTNPVSPNRTVNLSLAAEVGSGGHVSHSGTRPLGTLAATQGTTNANGVFQTTYTAAIFGGVIDISGRIGQSTEQVLQVIVAVNGLSELGASADYSLVGGTTTHPSNHWGTTTALTNLPLIASDYLSQFPGADILKYNDMSLVYGGKFDFDGSNWCSSCAHAEHRIGINCDVYSGNVPSNRWNALEDIFRSRHTPDFLDETASASHWHLRFQ